MVFLLGLLVFYRELLTVSEITHFSRFSETQFPLLSSPLKRAIIFLPPLFFVA